MILTKKAFAARCGVSTVTLYKWIDNNAHGIKDYVKPEGIDDSFFNSAAGKKIERGNKKGTAKAARDQRDIDIALLQQQIEAQRETIERLERTIEGLERDKAYIQGQYQQQADIVARLTLPAPRRTFGQAVKDLFGIKSKQEPQI